jgi:hypothetical protein
MTTHESRLTSHDSHESRVTRLTSHDPFLEWFGFPIDTSVLFTVVVGPLTVLLDSSSSSSSTSYLV